MHVRDWGHQSQILGLPRVNIAAIIDADSENQLLYDLILEHNLRPY